MGLTEFDLVSGMTPVREAIRRLISDGAAHFSGQPSRDLRAHYFQPADIEANVFHAQEFNRNRAFAGDPAKNISVTEIDYLEQLGSNDCDKYALW